MPKLVVQDQDIDEKSIVDYKLSQAETPTVDEYAVDHALAKLVVAYPLNKFEVGTDAGKFCILCSQNGLDKIGSEYLGVRLVVKK